MLFYHIIWNVRRWNMQCALHIKWGEHPRCLCAHANVMFLGNLFWASEDKPKVQIQHFSSWLHVWLDNLNTGSLGAACGEYVSFSYTWSHTGWPVMEAGLQSSTKNQQRETERWVWLHSCPYSWSYLLCTPLLGFHTFLQFMWFWVSLLQLNLSLQFYILLLSGKHTFLTTAAAADFIDIWRLSCFKQQGDIYLLCSCRCAVAAVPPAAE